MTLIEQCCKVEILTILSVMIYAITRPEPCYAQNGQAKNVKQLTNKQINKQTLTQ